MFPQLGTGRDAPPVPPMKAKALAYAKGRANREIKTVHASVAATFRATSDHEGALPRKWFITDAQADHANGVIARRFAQRRQRYDDCECSDRCLANCDPGARLTEGTVGVCGQYPWKRPSRVAFTPSMRRK